MSSASAWFCSASPVLLAVDPAGANEILGLSVDGWITAFVLLGIVVGLVFELASPDFIVLSGLAVLLIGGIVEPHVAFSGFAKPAVLTIASLLVVAAAVRRCGVLTYLERLMQARSSRMAPALVRVMLPSSIFSAFLNNTPIVAALTPMVREWARKAGIPASKLLMPLSFATILGGMGTLVGTSTNLVVSDLLAQRESPPLAMFELLWIGAPAALVGCLYFAFVGHRLLPAGDGDGSASAERAYQFDLRLPAASPFVGQTIERAGLRHLRDAFLAHIVRHGEVFGPVGPNITLEAGDTLGFVGNPRVMDDLLAQGHLTRVVDPPAGGATPELPLFEAVLSPESSLVGTTLKDADFRERFQAAVVGIHRRGRRVESSIGLSVLEPGDLLLIEARPNFEKRWIHSGEFYLVAPIERERGHDPRRATVVTLVLLAMVSAVALGLLPMVSASLAAAVIVVLIGALSPSEARRAIDVSVLIVIAAAIGVGEAIRASGLDQVLAQGLFVAAKGLGPFGIVVAVYVATNLLTEFLTNSVAAVILFPIGMAAATAGGVEPKAMAIAIATAASASFATPIGYQTNLMVMSPGGYRVRDYLRAGLPLNLLIMVVALAIIWWRWL